MRRRQAPKILHPEKAKTVAGAESEKIPSDDLQQLLEATASGDLRARRLVNALHSSEVSRLLTSLPRGRRLLLWHLVAPDARGDILVDLGEEVRETLIEDMDTEELLRALDSVDIDDLVDFLQALPDTLAEELLRDMDQDNRARLEQYMGYPEDSAGGLMDTDTLSVRSDCSLEVVQRYLRMRGAMPPGTDKLMVVDRNDRLIGVLHLPKLLTTKESSLVSDAMDRDYISFKADTPADEVARLFEDRDLLSAPVTGENSYLLGRVTVDDVVDFVRSSTEESLLQRAGVRSDEDLFRASAKSFRNRSVWLGINLATALVTAWFIGFFQHTIERVVALAVIMPAVASMGGIAGIQTMTLVIRAQALNYISPDNSIQLLIKEISLGLISSLIWASSLAVISWLWFGHSGVSLVIAVATAINLIAGALAGVLIPLGLRRIHLDPAVSGGVLLTTVTDVVGFVTLLGLATSLMIWN